MATNTTPNSRLPKTKRRCKNSENTNNKIKCVGYVRASTEQQAQEKAIKDWVVAKGYDLVYIGYDVGTDGTGRSVVLDECLAKVEKGGILVIHNVNILTKQLRDVYDLISIKRKLKKQGASIISVVDSVNINNPYSFMMVGMIIAMKEIEGTKIATNEQEEFVEDVE